MQFCGLGVPVARRYYHAKKKSDESPLDYLYRLNVIDLRAKLKIKKGSPKIQKEKVEQYIQTVVDPELAEQLKMLRLADVEELEEVLKARKKTKARRGKTLFVSSKFQQRVPAPSDRPRNVSRCSVHSVRATLKESSSEGSVLDNSDNDEDLRQIYLAGRDPSPRTARDSPPREVDQHRNQAEYPGTAIRWLSQTYDAPTADSGDMET
uniref:Uncharacterized protein n=1 Tax=Hyaloperonospora arabidopsidis (strain Emoy2) TaxID=559515 RepID=M4BR80_HYAAE